ncbi:hypothetical protein LINPERHAP2_LOCUS5009, partial [Linum perenne]
SRLFEIEFELAKITQGDRDINTFYTAASDLWTEQDLLSMSMLSSAASAEILAERNRTRVLQFLMKLRPEFETVRSQAIANNTTDIEDILGDLVRVETRLNTQAQLDGIGSSANGVANSGNVFVTGRRPQFYSHSGRNNTNRNTPASSNNEMKCRHCHIVGHSVAHCRQRNVCNYCRNSGHIILECPILKNKSPRPGRPVYTAQSSTVDSFSDSASVVSDSSSSIDSLVKAALSRYMPSAVQATFSAAGVLGNHRNWHLDSAAFNHMTSDLSLFNTYHRVKNLAVETANGQRLDVAGVGHVHTPSLDLPNTLHVPWLVPNLVSVGQLTDSGCKVTFSPSGCDGRI